MTEQCPKCGSELRTKNNRFKYYLCGSWEGDELHRTSECKWYEVHNNEKEELRNQLAAKDAELVVARRALENANKCLVWFMCGYVPDGFVELCDCVKEAFNIDIQADKEAIALAVYEYLAEEDTRKELGL